MHSTAAATIGGSPSTNLNVNHYQHSGQQTHQTQYNQVNQPHSQPISSPTQHIQQAQPHLHPQQHNHNNHQLVRLY